MPAADAPPGERRRADALALALLTALVLGAHAEVLLGRAVFCWEDFVFWYAPTRQLVGDALRAGHLAQWDPWVGLGQSLAFNPAAGPLYLPGLLQLLGDDLPGLHRVIVGHLLLGGVALYALARDRGARPSAAFVAGAGFAFAGPVLSYAQENPYHVMGLAWVPLALLAYLRALERRGAAAAVGAGAALALVLYAGEPQNWYFAGFTLLAAGLAHGLAAGRPPAAGALRALGWLAVVVAIALVLAAAQIAPTLAGLAESVRGQGEPESIRHAFSLHPARLVTWALPFATGALLPENSLWGSGLDGGYRLWLHTPYVGLAALVFAPEALRAGPRRPLAIALLAIAIFFMLMATGRHLGVYGLVESVVPGMGMFRYPEKWAAGAVVPLLLVAALGVEQALAGGRVRRVALGGAALALLGILAWTGASQMRPIAAAVATYPAPGIVDAAVARLASDGRHAFAAALGLLLPVVLLGLRRLPVTAAGALLAAVATADLVVVGLTPLALAPPELFTDPGPVAEAMRAHEAHARFRREPNPASLGVPADLRGYVRNQVRNRWTGSTHSLIGVQRHVLVHGPAVVGREGALLREALWGDHPIEGGALLGTRFYVVGDREPPAWLAAALESGRLTTLATFPELRALLASDPRALPRALRVHRTEIAQESARPEVLRAYLERRFPFEGAALVDASDALVSGRAGHAAPPALAGTSAGAPARFRLDGAERVVLETDGPEPGLLVLTDSFVPGWRAWVDDVEVPVHRVNFVARGVAVPAGPAVVRFEYRAPGLSVGLGVTAGGALLALGAALRRRRATATPVGASATVSPTP